MFPNMVNMAEKWVKVAYNFLDAEPIPVAVMADADKAMTSSISDLIPNALRLTCFFHVKTNLKLRLTKV